MSFGAMTDSRNPGRLKRIGLGGDVLVGLVTVAVVGSVGHHRGYWPAVLAAVLGSLVAVAELVSRYRDDPSAALISLPAMIYVGVNAGASLGALYLIGVFGWNFEASGSQREVMRVLTAGFGSAALFRSSLFNVTAGDQVIGIGPSAVLNVILAAADRAVDRQRAVIRLQGRGVPVPISEVQRETGLDYWRTAQALGSLIDGNLVELGGQPGAQTVSIKGQSG